MNRMFSIQYSPWFTNANIQFKSPGLFDTDMINEKSTDSARLSRVTLTILSTRVRNDIFGILSWTTYTMAIVDSSKVKSTSSRPCMSSGSIANEAIEVIVIWKMPLSRFTKKKER